MSAPPTSASESAQHPGLSKPVIGLTGAPGSGKSAVAQALAELGGGVVDADALARAALDDVEVRDALKAWWGEAALNREGRVNRPAVARIVFRDDAARRRLESLIHPRVATGRAELHARFASDPRIRFVVEDCPLLLETGLDAGCDAVWFVDAPRDQRLRRVEAGRGWSASDLHRRENSQLRLDTKRSRADDVLVNDGDLATLRDRVRQALESFLERLSPDRPSARFDPPAHAGIAAPPSPRPAVAPPASR